MNPTTRPHSATTMPNGDARPARSRRAASPSAEDREPDGDARRRRTAAPRAGGDRAAARPIGVEPARPAPRTSGCPPTLVVEAPRASSSGRYISAHRSIGLVDLRTEHDVQRQVQPERLRRHAQRVLAQRQPPGRERASRAGRPQPRDRSRRARASTVVEEVVVLVEAVLGPRVHLQRRLQRRASSRAADSAPGSRCCGSRAGTRAITRRQRRHRQPVVQPAAQEIEDQPRRIEPERAEVVDAVGRRAARPGSRSRCGRSGRTGDRPAPSSSRRRAADPARPAAPARSGPGGAIVGRGAARSARAPAPAPARRRRRRARRPSPRRLAHAAQHRREEAVGVVTVGKQLQRHAVAQLLGALAAPDLLDRAPARSRRARRGSARRRPRSRAG